MVVRQVRSSLTAVRLVLLAELSVRFPRRENVERQGVGHGAKARDDYRVAGGEGVGHTLARFSQHCSVAWIFQIDRNGDPPAQSIQYPHAKLDLFARAKGPCRRSDLDPRDSRDDVHLPCERARRWRTAWERVRRGRLELCPNHCAPELPSSQHERACAREGEIDDGRVGAQRVRNDDSRGDAMPSRRLGALYIADEIRVTVNQPLHHILAKPNSQPVHLIRFTW